MDFQTFSHLKKSFIFLAVMVLPCSRALSLVSVSEGYSLLMWGLLIAWLLLLQSTGSGHMGFGSCGSWALGCGGSNCVKWAPEGSSGQCLTRCGASGCLAGHRSEPVADSWIPGPLGLGLESSWPLGLLLSLAPPIFLLPK